MKYFHLGALALLPIGVTAFALPAAIQPLPPIPEAHTLRVTTWSNALEPIGNSRIKFVQNGLARFFNADATGQTPGFSIATNSTASIIVKQRSTFHGLCLGQAYTDVFPHLGLGFNVYDSLTVFQPLLEAETFDSSLDRPISSDHTGRYGFYPLPESSFLFDANVGLLMTPREIDALADYYGVQFGYSDYRMGLVIHTEDVEDLDYPGAALEIDFESYGFAGIPASDPYFLTTSAANLGQANFEAYPEAWEFDHADVADYTFSGRLGKGLNILLFREGISEGLVELLGVAPSFPPPVQQQSGGMLPAVSDCTPPTPAPSGNELCALTSPTDDPGCAPTGCGPATPSDCQTTFTKVGGKLCGGGSGGATASQTFGVTTTFRGGVSVDFSILGTGGSASAGVDRSVTESLQLTVGAGAHGCGQCAQAYKKLVVCNKTCVVHKRQYSFWGTPLGCMDVTETSSCVDTSTEVTHCDRTGC